jgi:signal transduction histidine kinase
MLIRLNEASIDFSIIISDSGIGIAEDQTRQNIRNVQPAERPRRQALCGTGLGLAISKRFANLWEQKLELKAKSA